MSYRPDLDADYPFRCDCICGCRDVKWKNGVNHGGKHLCSVCVIREGRGDCDHGTELCPSAQAWKDKFDAMTSGWIKITDDPKTLPQERTWVIVCSEHDGQRHVAPGYGIRLIGGRWRWESEFTVIAWMPLPAPPAAEQTEES